MKAMYEKIIIIFRQINKWKATIIKESDANTHRLNTTVN